MPNLPISHWNFPPLWTSYQLYQNIKTREETVLFPLFYDQTMLQNITGLYLGHIKYGDTSVILKLYTQSYGTVSFILKGIKKQKGKSALLQPFHYIELQSSFKSEKELNFGSKLHLHTPTKTITSDIRKTTVAIFLTEVLNKTLQEAAPNTALYRHIESLIRYFDQMPFSSVFHYFFLTELIKHLGIQPHKSNTSYNILNLESGCFEQTSTREKHYLSEEESAFFSVLLGTNFDALNTLKIPTTIKSIFLENLIKYIEIQTEIPRKSIRSYKILETVFHD